MRTQSRVLKTVFAVFGALALTISLTGEANAVTRKKQHAYRHHTMREHTQPEQGGSDYYEHLLDKVPFGSQRWWSIYEEQHGSPN